MLAFGERVGDVVGEREPVWFQALAERWVEADRDGDGVQRVAVVVVVVIVPPVAKVGVFVFGAWAGARRNGRGEEES